MMLLFISYIIFILFSDADMKMIYLITFSIYIDHIFFYSLTNYWADIYFDTFTPVLPKFHYKVFYTDETAN